MKTKVPSKVKGTLFQTIIDYLVIQQNINTKYNQCLKMSFKLDARFSHSGMGHVIFL